ncbi:hypothetical protein JTH13_004338 [Escherichia coli]|nr:hypothetical protein [Escherichia coli]EFI4582592.1 hypothetical protein [Escherichia coli]EGF1732334.1 hypothetical protein [Escherichia coli]EHC4479184.1 hypothetical protein [Escherichia coli]EHD0943424.1 hypothetical protein [Escherichia coli]
MDTSGFDIQFDNHIPENGYRIEGYLCNANNAKECQAIMVRSEPFHQIDYSAMGKLPEIILMTITRVLILKH